MLINVTVDNDAYVDKSFHNVLIHVHQKHLVIHFKYIQFL